MLFFVQVCQCWSRLHRGFSWRHHLHAGSAHQACLLQDRSGFLTESSTCRRLVIEFWMILDLRAKVGPFQHLQFFYGDLGGWPSLALFERAKLGPLLAIAAHLVAETQRFSWIFFEFCSKIRPGLIVKKDRYLGSANLGDKTWSLERFDFFCSSQLDRIQNW